MKKIILIGILMSVVFANTLEERVKILEQKVAQLEKKLNIVDKTQKNLKKDITNNTILKCNKLILKNYSYTYSNDVLTQSYDFTYTVKNDYNKTINYVYASISFSDKNHIKMVEDYIKKSVKIKPHQEVKVTTNYLIDGGGLAETLKDTPKKDIKVKLVPFEIDFSDGQVLKCR